MTEINYVVTVRGLIPESLPRKIAEAHAEAVKPRHCSHSRSSPGVITSKTAAWKKKPTST